MYHVPVDPKIRSSHAVTGHRALYINDIVRTVFEEILDAESEEDLKREARWTLVQLSRTCKAFSPHALELLWRDLPSLAPLLSLLAPLRPVLTDDQWLIDYPEYVKDPPEHNFAYSTVRRDIYITNLMISSNVALGVRWRNHALWCFEASRIRAVCSRLAHTTIPPDPCLDLPSARARWTATPTLSRASGSQMHTLAVYGHHLPMGHGSVLVASRLAV